MAKKTQPSSYPARPCGAGPGTAAADRSRQAFADRRAGADRGVAPGVGRESQAQRLRARTVGGDAWLGHIEDQVVVLVTRRGGGMAALVARRRALRAAARSHSADMRARGYLAHQAPDGGTPSDRMRTAGYSWPAAENIACGQQRPHEVMHAWMNSPGHRANILNPVPGPSVWGWIPARGPVVDAELRLRVTMSPASGKC